MHSYRSSSGSRDAEIEGEAGGLKSQGRGIDVDLVRQVGKEEAFSLSFFISFFPSFCLLLSKSCTAEGKKRRAERMRLLFRRASPSAAERWRGGAEHDMSERWGPANQ